MIDKQAINLIIGFFVVCGIAVGAFGVGLVWLLTSN